MQSKSPAGSSQPLIHRFPMVLAIGNDPVGSCFSFTGMENELLAIPAEIFLCAKGVFLTWLQADCSL